MRIAIIGASSQIAKDLICAFGSECGKNLLLYVRDVAAAEVWLKSVALCGAGHRLRDYGEYGRDAHDAVINFVGVGDPRRAVEMGSSIWDVTHSFDNLVLNQLIKNPERRYIFISSGAAYGDSFEVPVDARTASKIHINNILTQDYYAVAKLSAELRHRSYSDFAITDVRVFNYFSRSQDLNARFLITDVIRAIRDKSLLLTSEEYMVRDFLHPIDFVQLIRCILLAPPTNCSVDCYTREAIDKPSLLKKLQEHFELMYEVSKSSTLDVVNATNKKTYYYSTNRKAEEFGYFPKLSSWDGILMEAEAILLNV